MKQRVVSKRFVMYATFVLILIAALVMSLFLVNRANAANVAVPGGVTKTIKKVCHGGAGVAQATWLADKKKSNSTTIEVDYGAKSVKIGIYGIRKKCKKSSTRGGWSYVVSPSVSGKGKISGLDGFSYNMKYPSAKKRYYSGLKGTFTYTNKSGITANQTIKIKSYSAGTLYGGSHPASPGECADAVSSDKKKGGPGKKCNAEKSIVILTIKVKPDYNLTPSLSGDSGIFEAGSALHKVSATISTPRSMATNRQSTWWFGKATILPGGGMPSQLNRTTPYKSSGIKLEKLGSGSKSFKSGATAVDSEKPTLDGDLQVGTKVCWLLAVKPPKNNYPHWRYATPLCVTIGKKPKLQVLGDDVRATGSIHTSTSILSTQTFGSWVEFGSVSVGDNIGFASGAGLRGGSSRQNQAGWSDLTFANTTSSSTPSGESQFGHYNTRLPPAADLRDYFDGRAKKTFSGDSLSGKSGAYNVGNLTINDSDNLKNTVVIVSSGTVKINGNITLSDGSYSSLGQIPQVVIIAKNIKINSSVTNIDAWLVSDGYVNTCSDKIAVPKHPTADPADGKLSSAICDKPLRINGPVAAQNLYLYRTAGSEGNGDRGTPAETINLRPDAYLWAYEYSLGFNQLNTVLVQERPPRY